MEQSNLPTTEKILKAVAAAVNVDVSKLTASDPQKAAITTTIRFVVKMLINAGGFVCYPMITGLSIPRVQFVVPSSPLVHYVPLLASNVSIRVTYLVQWLAGSSGSALQTSVKDSNKLTAALKELGITASGKSTMSVLLPTLLCHGTYSYYNWRSASAHGCSHNVSLTGHRQCQDHHQRVCCFQRA